MGVVNTKIYIACICSQPRGLHSLNFCAWNCSNGIIIVRWFDRKKMRRLWGAR
jgi:hypothetical protein